MSEVRPEALPAISGLTCVSCQQRRPPGRTQSPTSRLIPTPPSAI